ncbi:ABC transporter substrate-binding protein [Nocardioides sp. LHG3406-4]|uniref:ABC transporter substrate-binding protein n=1 Tax=Nocardioides sp. LHG3406-4 TaxID=2804575 RepID=UPI003CF5D42D
MTCIVITLGASLAACGGGSSDAGGGGGGSRTVSGEFVSAPTSFDPARATARDDYVANALMFDTLVHNDENATYVGGLATDWEAKSASEYVFTIRDDATCADGTKITAGLVADSLNYFADQSAGNHVSAPLVFGPGKPTITADDDASVVTIKTAAPYVNLVAGLAIPQSGIVCPAGLDDPKALAQGTAEGAASGPYTLAESKAGVSYTFKLRDDYDAWPEYATPLEGTPPPEIVFSMATDDATSSNKMLSGDLDFALLGGESIERFADSSDQNKELITFANGYVMFNERPGHYFADNQPARQAVARAIDRDAFNQIFSNGEGELFNSVVPSSYRCVNTDESLIEPLDPAAAASVLDGASIKIIASNSFGGDGKAAEYIQQVLTDAGADVKLDTVDNATWASTINDPSGDWDLTIQGDLNSLKVISASLDRVMGPAIEDGGRNIPGNDNAEGAEALKKALSTVDPDEQCAAYQTAQKTMLERDDVVPMAGITWLLISSGDVTLRAPNDTIDYTTLRISD